MTKTLASDDRSAPLPTERRPDTTVPLRAGEADPGRNATVEQVALLAHWWSRPTPDEREAWSDCRDAAARIGGTSSALTWLDQDETAAAALLDEHERLFVGPGPVPCPPYESYWRQDVADDMRGSLMGPCTADLRDLYALLGLEIKPNSGQFTDYLPIELEALGYALGLPEHGEVAGRIFLGHLHGWLPRLAMTVQRATRHPFYRELALMTIRWDADFEAYLSGASASG